MKNAFLGHLATALLSWKFQDPLYGSKKKFSVYRVHYIAGLVWQVEFRHIFINILGPDAYFSKPIFALKPSAQAGRFEYNEPYKRKTFFFDP